MSCKGVGIASAASVATFRRQSAVLSNSPFCLSSSARNCASLRGAFRPSLRPVTQESVLLCVSSEAAGTATTELLELKASNYYSFLNEEAGSDLVVVDFFTDWCGPCKLMYPELVLLQEKLRDRGVRIVKFNCNKENKAIGKELDIKVAPTFFLYKNGEKLASMTGAKLDKLKALIEEHM